jgi:hypothetical protein
MAISSQGATFTFPGITAHYTSISVEEPEAEVVDVTKIDAPLSIKRHMMATGDYTSPGSVSVDYIRLAGTAAPMTLTGLEGQLSISHANISVSKKAVLQSATSEMAVGDFLRGTLTFVIDHSTP